MASPNPEKLAKKQKTKKDYAAQAEEIKEKKQKKKEENVAAKEKDYTPKTAIAGAVSSALTAAAAQKIKEEKREAKPENKVIPSLSAQAVSSEAPKDYSSLPVSPIQRGRQAVGENIARAAGVKQETLDEIRANAAEKFGKDIFSESVDSGIANFAANTVGGLEFLSKFNIPTAILGKTFGEEYNPLSVVNEPLQQWKQQEAAEAKEAVERTGKGKSAEMSSQIISTVTTAIPDMVLSIATAGTSKAATGALKGIKAFTNTKTFLPAIKQAAVSTAKNPSFWLNFEQMLYPEYESALMNGATETEANVTALLSAFGQAQIESGSGFQKLPNASANSVRKAIIDYVKSAAAEGNEEVLQSIVSGITQKIVFDHDKEMFSTTSGENAVFNMADAFYEWLMGLFAGGILSAPGGIVNATSATTQNDINITQGGIPATADAVQTTETDVPAEAPVISAEPPVAETANAIPEVQNEQEAPFANAEETEEATPTMIDRIVQLASEGRSTAEIENIIRQEYDVANEKEPENEIGVQNETEYIPEDAQNNVREDEGYKGGAHPNTVGGMQSQKPFYKALNEFGAQPLRKEQLEKDNYFEVPKKLSENVAVSENVGYMAGSKLGDDDYMDDVIQHPEKYAHQINTDAESMQRAIDEIQNNGLDEAYGTWREKIDKKQMIEKDDVTKAAMTALFYQNKAKTETDPQKKAEYRKRALDIKADINYAATKGGQLLQSIQVLQNLVDTDGINLKEDGEYIAKKLVEKLNADRNGKGKEIVLNQVLVDKAIEAAGTEAEGKAWDEVYKDLANQTSTSFWERLNNYRYWCMLSNPRTHIRNVVSNMSMAIVNGVKDAVKTPIELAFNAYAKGRAKKAIEKDSKINQLIAEGKTKEAGKLEKKSERLHKFDKAQQRTTAIYSRQDFRFAIKDFDNAKKIFDTSGKYADSSNTNKFIKEYKTNTNSDFIGTYLSRKIKGDSKFSKAMKTVFEHGGFGSIMDFNTWLLSDVEDGSFKALTYAHELAQRMKANGITAETATRPGNLKKMDNLRAEAFAEALYNTFNEDSPTADAIKKLSQVHPSLHVLTETLLPFKKVPINILSTAADYSPIGFAKGLGEMAKIMRNPESMDTGKAINDLAKGTTGLVLMGIGAFLRSIGKITNGLSDDDDEKNFQKLLGEQAFAIKLDDGSSYSVEWLGSSVMPMFVGALAYDFWNGELKEKINSENALSVALSGLVGTLASIGNPMIEMSMLSNIEYTLTNQYDSFEDFFIDLLGNYANQFVPQVLNAVTKTSDNTKRNAYYVDKTDKIPDILQIPIQTAMSKIPGLSKNLSAQVDAWGETKKHSDRDTKLGWAFDAFISPGTYKKNATTEEDKLIAQLVADTGNTNLYPKGPSQKYVTVDTVKYPLSAKEYEQMSIEQGKKKRELVKQLVANDMFKSLSLENKEKTVKQLYGYAGALSKEGLHGYELETEWEKIQDAKADGLPEIKYLMVKAAKSGMEKTETKSETQVFLDYLIPNKNLSEKEKIVATEYLTDINMDKFKAFSKDPMDIINSYNMYLGEQGKEGGHARMVSKIIADKSTTPQEDVAFIENVLGTDMSKYKAATSKASEQLDLYRAVSDSNNKEADINSLIKKGYSAPEALAKYNVSSGTKKYENGEFKFGNSTKQKEKAEKLKNKGYSPLVIVKAANAVTSLGNYGTVKNYSTFVKMLEAVGITDKKFQKDFWNIYM